MKIAGGEGIICALTDDGKALAFDDCMDIVRLPVPGSTVIKSLEVFS